MQIVLPLDESSEIPLYRQVVDGIVGMITDGRLGPGSKLPSTRELAEHLGISRFTTSKAYEELSRQGYIETSSSVGTFVSRTLVPLQKRAMPVDKRPVDIPDAPIKSLRLSEYGERIMTSPAIESTHIELFEELNYCAPAPEQLPISKWRELLVKCSRERELSFRTYVSDVFGHEALRVALADYLSRSRGIRCSYEQICVFSGAQPALDLLSCLLITEGDTAFVENPGFPGARRLFTSYGGRLRTIPVDAGGVMVERLLEQDAEGKLMYVTPSHHDPTGVVLSAPRRKKLLSWAAEKSVWIIEDDFDSEFRYGDKPLPALQAQDEAECVIYLSAFWKIMFPVLRLGFVVVPRRFVPVLRKAKSLAERDFHYVEHEALAHFITEGHLERHVRRTRAIYARRRQALIAKLNADLTGKVRISPVSAGTHLLVRFETAVPEEKLLASAREARLPMVSTRAYYWEGAVDREVLIPFAHVEESEIEKGVDRFLEICPL